jgi:glycosyltransferase involved in cell wall biosynthesis
LTANSGRRSRIAHLTSVHARHDTRIFVKQCRSLARAGHEVFLIVADGQGDEERDGVRILDAGEARGRLDRMLRATRRVLKKALALDADLYQLHDPELLPAGLALKRRGYRVVFDSHEDVPRQILSKAYLPSFVRRPVSLCMGTVERFACGRLDGVIAATPAIADKFSGIGIAAICIGNFPISDELRSGISAQARRRDVCYVGGISRVRGIVQMVEALALTRSDTGMTLAGRFEDAGTRADVVPLAGWQKVREAGFLSRPDVRDLLGRSIAGMVVFLPEPNHIAAQPNKIFEYMSAGLPIIASDFPLWREVIEGSECGICVDPLDPAAIAAAIDRLAEDPALASRLGHNGRRAVEERYNWEIEERRFLEFYERLLAGGRTSGTGPTGANMVVTGTHNRA